MKLSMEEVIEAVKEELLCYEDMEEYAQQWEKEFREWVKKKYPKLAHYMCRNISIMMAISSIHLLLKGDEQAKSRHLELWSDIKKSNPGLYYRLRYTKLSGFTNLPGKLGKLATVGGYRLARRIYQFQ